MLEFLQNNIKLVSSIAILVALGVGKLVADRFVCKKVEAVRARYAWRQFLNVATLTLATLLMVYTWFDWFRSMLTLLSLVAAALIIVNKELVLNLFSYTVLVWRGVFVIGDRISIDGAAGDVIRVGPFYFELAECVEHQYTGRTVRVPNSLIMSKQIVNDSRANHIVWHTITVTNNLMLCLGDTIDQQRRTLLKIVQPLELKLTSELQEQIRRSKLELPFSEGTGTTVQFLQQDDQTVAKVRYLCDVHHIHTTEAQFWESYIQFWESWLHSTRPS